MTKLLANTIKDTNKLNTKSKPIGIFSMLTWLTFR